MDDVGQAAYDVHHNAHQGKVGVLTLAPEEGLGVRDPEKRAKHLDAINRFRGALKKDPAAPRHSQARSGALQRGHHPGDTRCGRGGRDSCDPLPADTPTSVFPSARMSS